MGPPTGSPALPVQPPWLQGGGHVPTRRLDQFFLRLSPRTRPPPWGPRALPGSQGRRPASFQGSTHHLQDARAPQPQVYREEGVATVLILSCPSCTSLTVMEGKVVTGTLPVSVRKHSSCADMCVCVCVCMCALPQPPPSPGGRELSCVPDSTLNPEPGGGCLMRLPGIPGIFKLQC